MAIESDADRYADVKLNLACPKCGSEGLIPLDGLDHMLYCHGCQSRFALERQGLVEIPDHHFHVQVRSHLSDWAGHHAVLDRRSEIFGHWMVDRVVGFFIEGRLRWFAMAGAILLTVAGIAIGNRAPTQKAPLVIPDSLPGRAQLFTQALAKRDMELMIRLTDSRQHRAMRIWFAHLTDIPESTDDELEDVKVEVISTVPSASGDRADLRLQVTSPGGKPIVVDEQWAQKVTGWCFQPVRWRAQAPPKGSVKAYSKQRR
jgi:hypothetical protein